MFANRSHVTLGHVCDQLDWNGPFAFWWVLAYWIPSKTNFETNFGLQQS